MAILAQISLLPSFNFIFSAENIQDQYSKKAKVIIRSELLQSGRPEPE